MSDLSELTYEDLVDLLRKDLQIDLSLDALPHTGNDPAAFQSVPTSWYGSNWTGYATSGAWIPQYWIDANGWVHLRGLVKPIVAYSYGAANATVLVLPTSICPRTIHMFQQIGNDSAANYYVGRMDLVPAGGTPSSSLFVVGGVGTNNGGAGWLNLNGIRWNYKS